MMKKLSSPHVAASLKPCFDYRPPAEAHVHGQERRKRRNGDYDDDYKATHRYGGSHSHHGRDQTDSRYLPATYVAFNLVLLPSRCDSQP